jgi:glutamate synthase domain-containing protein 2
MKTRWTRVLPAVPIAAVAGVAVYDLAQKKHALLRNYSVVKHRSFAKIAPHPGVHSEEDAVIPCAKVFGGPRKRAQAFRPNSVVNISGMSFGALSGAAIEALNRGAAAAGCLHNTGEGGLSPHHLHGADVIFQIGTSYFGCRDNTGRFDI